MTSSSNLSFTPSPNVAGLRESATIAASQHAKRLRAEGRPVIDLGAGEPDFETPEFIRSAAARAIEAGLASRYTAPEGIAPLRQAIAAYTGWSSGNRHAIGADEVLVTSGSKQAIFNACFALFGAGDEVLIPTPGWTSYYEIVSLARATPVAVEGDRSRQLMVDAAALERAATSRTRGLILNSPCNPTGAVYGAEALAEILDLAEHWGWWVIADEIYRRIAYGAGAPSFLQVATGRERLVIVDGVAKAFAMPGWRIGWSVATLPLTRIMTGLQSHTTFHPAAIAQHAAHAALSRREEADPIVAVMVASYRARRDAALEVACDAGIPHLHPDGAFYLFFDVTRAFPTAGEPGSTFALALLDRHSVSVVPGAAFRAPAWIRVSYAAPIDDVVEGVRRIGALLNGR